MKVRQRKGQLTGACVGQPTKWDAPYYVWNHWRGRLVGPIGGRFWFIRPGT